MNLQPRTEDVLGTLEFMQTTQGMVFKVGGVTLSAAAFADDAVVKGGTAVVVGADGLAVPWADGAAGTPYITVHDVRVGDQNVITGALEQGWVRRDRITGSTAAFETAVSGRIHFR